jgi:phage shock protein PspC (stress-responsive transcriptional regulator)
MKTMKKYYRTRKDNFVGGVMGGLGVFLNFDPLLLRLAFLYALVMGGEPIARFAIPAYLALWFFAPMESVVEEHELDFEDAEAEDVTEEKTTKP